MKKGHVQNGLQFHSFSRPSARSCYLRQLLLKSKRRNNKQKHPLDAGWDCGASACPSHGWDCQNTRGQTRNCSSFGACCCSKPRQPLGPQVRFLCLSGSFVLIPMMPLPFYAVWNLCHTQDFMGSAWNIGTQNKCPNFLKCERFKTACRCSFLLSCTIHFVQECCQAEDSLCCWAITFAPGQRPGLPEHNWPGCPHLQRLPIRCPFFWHLLYSGGVLQTRRPARRSA